MVTSQEWVVVAGNANIRAVQIQFTVATVAAPLGVRKSTPVKFLAQTNDETTLILDSICHGYLVPSDAMSSRCDENIWS